VSKQTVGKHPCGCDLIEVEPPEPRVAISAVATICSHGTCDFVSDWVAIEEESEGYQTFPLVALINRVSQLIITAMDDDEDWMPHTMMYLFHYADVQSTNFCTGLAISLDGSLVLHWDPCMRRNGHFHRKVRATEWLLRGIAKEESLPDITIAVID
jgi:hypothetical protein